MGSGSKSYMRNKGLTIHEEMRKFFTIYDFAPEEILFYFLSV
jgi:hypothetical protein